MKLRSARMPPLPPDLLGEYDVTLELGFGGAGQVLAVVRRRDEQRFALKILPKARIVDRGWVKTPNWEQGKGLEVIHHPGGRDEVVVCLEAWLLRRIDHPGVVKFEALYADPDFFYLLMEFHGANWGEATAALVQPTAGSNLAPVSTADIAESTATLDFVLPQDFVAGSRSQPTLPTKASRRIPDVLSTPTLSCPPTPELSEAGTRNSGTGEVQLMHSPALAFPRPLRPMATPPSTPLPKACADLFQCLEHHDFKGTTSAWYIFHQIVEIVASLADLGVAHRDIKDENIVIDEHYRVKLVDFGSALVCKPTITLRSFHGTRLYASPQILLEQAYLVYPAEVWSLGVLFVVLLTRRYPFASRDDAVQGKMCPKVWKSLVSTSTTSDNGDGGAMDIINRCLQVDVEERISLQDLRQVVQDESERRRRAEPRNDAGD